MNPTDDPFSVSRGVYAISVAAELTGIGVQSLRLYERHGLVQPERTDGGTRRYSAADLDRLRRVSELLAEGINLAGVARILALQDANDALTEANARLEDTLDAQREED
ncbi:MerR family transcriptional regulator [Skermania sp. ID1734]|uniref:heat shock protein transcriptional repressor HspR n=1 Tax=Skermania sp. ID1734 TaxID=2597516 RepID=UPI00117D53EA|nr:MerR family transcriptional regulator [Skermania sp. ID1734]TSD93537.1 MerR family transcriptional regulator [Skermania sp. ID1734]